MTSNLDTLDTLAASVPPPRAPTGDDTQLDHYLAVHAMFYIPQLSGWQTPRGLIRHFSPSRNLKDADKLVKAMAEWGFRSDTVRGYKAPGLSRYLFTFRRGDSHYSGDAETLALAICRAAKTALGCAHPFGSHDQAA